MKIFLFITCFIFLISACNKDEEEEKPLVKEGSSVNWAAVADSSSMALISIFWEESKQYFVANNYGGTSFQYWPQAHALDVVTDAYLRTGNNYYKSFFDKWFSGVREGNGNKWKNNFFDDMEWIALTLLRLYSVTNEIKYRDAAVELWGYIKDGWNNYAGGGIAWQSSELWKKNACSNGPACILAARLYQETGEESYKDWAEQIYNWEKSTLLQGDGAVLDHIDGRDNTFTNWKFTYNEGTFVGAAVELYKIFDNKSYLNDAILAANYTTGTLVTNSVLKLEGSSDSSVDNDAHLFKGIFIRYFTELIQQDIDSATKKRYLQFLKYNAETLWTKGAYKNPVLFGPDWATRPDMKTTLKATASGCMLMEAAALLAGKKLL
ncbi:MAG: glycosyl hydrolase family 76 [Tannerellaceae bacterium]|jgi:predicted alpha-1,6-mannanase (GH76 family)|nr:glycosyl hydrolase family 76 [Tannerellaceae bacterium]